MFHSPSAPVSENPVAGPRVFATLSFGKLYLSEGIVCLTSQLISETMSHCHAVHHALCGYCGATLLGGLGTTVISRDWPSSVPLSRRLL